MITYVFILNILIAIGYVLTQSKDIILKKLNKISTEKQANLLIRDLIYNDVNFQDDTFLLDYLIDKNWSNSYQLALEFLNNVQSQAVHEVTDRFIAKEKKIGDEFLELLKEKKKDIIRISPVFEWSQNDEEIKIRLKFAKNLETPGEKEVKNFKVNCTRSQLEVQAYKQLSESDDYIVHYYRRLNLYEFIRPSTCKGYKETDGTYIVTFHKNQYTLFWNFLNQPTESHYNLHTWIEVHSKYDDKIQYTEFRETAMENLLISDIEQYVKDGEVNKRKRIEKIKAMSNYLISKNQSSKNYCLSSINSEKCKLPRVDEWEYWQM